MTITPKQIAERIEELETFFRQWQADRERWPGWDRGPHLIAVESDPQLIDATAVAKKNGLDPMPIVRLQVGLIPDEKIDPILTSAIATLSEVKAFLIAGGSEPATTITETVPAPKSKKASAKKVNQSGRLSDQEKKDLQLLKEYEDAGEPTITAFAKKRKDDRTTVSKSLKRGKDVRKRLGVNWREFTD
jgi:hypothetical protein